MRHQELTRLARRDIEQLHSRLRRRGGEIDDSDPIMISHEPRMAIQRRQCLAHNRRRLLGRCRHLGGRSCRDTWPRRSCSLDWRLHRRGLRRFHPEARGYQGSSHGHRAGRNQRAPVDRGSFHHCIVYRRFSARPGVPRRRMVPRKEPDRAKPLHGCDQSLQRQRKSRRGFPRRLFIHSEEAGVRRRRLRRCRS